MNKSENYALLVGVYFTPPAKVLLQCLPAGALVHLVLDYDNPWDSHAVRVKVDPSALHADALEDFREEFASMATSPEEILTTQTSLWLGHCAATGGKPLEAARKKIKDYHLVGNQEISQNTTGNLLFLSDGNVLILLNESTKEPLDAIF